LAQQHDSSADENQHEKTTAVTRSRRSLRVAAPTTPTTDSRATRRASAAKNRRSPGRRVAVVGVIAALVGSVAIPAFAAAQSTPETRTLQQLANADAQSLVVASKHDGESEALDRSSYSATTEAEIEKKKAAEAAAARAKAAARAASYTSQSVKLNVTGPGTGAIRWPLAHVDHIGDGFMARGGEHQGVDLLDPARTPIFAAASGTVVVSSESYYGYGVAVSIDSNIGGQKVNTLYGHMTYGTRQVSVGQHVEVGQVIGAVGSTGRSTANHLHFEVAINGTKVDPLAWLRANAG